MYYSQLSSSNDLSSSFLHWLVCSKLCWNTSLGQQHLSQSNHNLIHTLVAVQWWLEEWNLHEIDFYFLGNNTCKDSEWLDGKWAIISIVKINIKANFCCSNIKLIIEEGQMVKVTLSQPNAFSAESRSALEWGFPGAFSAALDRQVTLSALPGLAGAYVEKEGNYWYFSYPTLLYIL